MILGVIIFIFILLFLPIPVKISFSYTAEAAKLKIYFKEIILNKPAEGKKLKPKKNKRKKFDYKKFLSKDKLLLFHKKFKKVFILGTLDIFIKFGLGDAANTALSYGLLNSCNFLIYTILNYLINTKRFSIKFVPDMNEKVFISEINSIFFISFAKIIYIIFIFIYIFFIKKEFKNSKEDYKWKTTQ